MSKSSRYAHPLWQYLQDMFLRYDKIYKICSSAMTKSAWYNHYARRRYNIISATDIDMGQFDWQTERQIILNLKCLRAWIFIRVITGLIPCSWSHAVCSVFYSNSCRLVTYVWIHDYTMIDYIICTYIVMIYRGNYIDDCATWKIDHRLLEVIIIGNDW